MKPLWERGSASVREIRDALPGSPPRAYTTVQTTVHRLELKGAVRCIGRVGKANVFASAVSRATVLSALVAQCDALRGDEV
jgi:BlaI family penicillinase repressor